MKYKILNFEQITDIYNTHMPEAFPKEEIRSFDNLKSLYERECYLAIGGFDEDELCIYGFFAVDKANNNYLLDYFSAVQGKRGVGIGTEFLNEVPRLVKTFNILFLEVERIECAKTSEETEIRTRRVAFYERNAYKMSEVKSIVYDYPFSVMYYNENNYSYKEIKSALTAMYKLIFTTGIYETKVKIY